MGIAYALLGLRTGDTSVSSGNDDSGGPGLGAKATALTASTPRLPGVLAVNRAGMGVAFNGVGTREACYTTVGSSCAHRASAGLHATTASGGAGTVAGPFSLHTGDRAKEGVAGDRLAESGASNATKGSLALDTAGLGLRAGGAGLGAGAPFTVARYHAVDRAGLSVAVLGLSKSGASNTTVSTRGGYATRAVLRASAAGLGAGGPGCPSSDYAIYGAGLSVAALLLRKRSTNVPAELRVGSYTTRAALGASAAGERAGGPGGPRGNFAVNRARAVGARLGLGQGRAGDAAMGNGGGNSAGTCLGTLGAGLRALGPSREGGDNAVNGAGLGVATAGLIQGRAYLAAEGDVTSNTAVASLGASATSQGAGGPLSPFGHYAINGTGMRVASAGIRCGAASNTTMSGGGGDGARTGLRATAAGHGTRAPGSP